MVGSPPEERQESTFRGPVVIGAHQEATTMRELAGKVAVITGAGSGFGREFARIGASERMKLVLADVQQDALDDAVAEARASGAEAIGVRADVSRAEEVRQLAARTQEKF